MTPNPKGSFERRARRWNFNHQQFAVMDERTAREIRVIDFLHAYLWFPLSQEFILRPTRALAGPVRRVRSTPAKRDMQSALKQKATKGAKRAQPSFPLLLL